VILAGAEAPPDLARPPAVAGDRLTLGSLRIRGFRNLAPATLSFPPDGVAIVGDNGQGKTNLLEAIYYLQLLRSIRGARDIDLVGFGEAAFHLTATADGGRAQEIAVGFERSARRKRVRLDGAETPRLSDALGALPSVIFSPADAALVGGAPSERRRFLDVTLALTSRRYLGALQQYRAALARRNAALRSAARAGSDASRAAVWEPALAEHGAVLWLERVAWTERYADRFTELCASIGEHGSARMRYETSLSSHDGQSDVQAALLDALEARRELDLRRGLTHAGPHRDDLAITLDGRELRTFGSAGQQRTAAIALRMLEAATLRERTRSAPLFLLDDPFAELDARRAHRILELLADAGLGQTVLAVPRAADIPAELTWLDRWTVRDGVIGAS